MALAFPTLSSTPSSPASSFLGNKVAQHARLACRATGFFVAVLLMVAVTSSTVVQAQDEAAEKPAGGPPQGPPPAQVRVDVVVRETVVEKVPIVGQLLETRSTVVASEEAGRVIEAKFELGDRVVAGKTVLARIDDFELKSQLAVEKTLVDEATKLVEEAQARLDRAQKDVNYLLELRKQKTGSQLELDNATTTLAAQAARLGSVRAVVEQRKAQIRRLEEKITRSVVYAPFDGFVVEKSTEVGQWLNPGSPVARIISAGAIDAVADVPERVVNDLKFGDPVQVRIEPLNLVVEGKVFAIVPAANKTARTFPVKIRLENKEGNLKAGMSITASIPSGMKSEHTLVHQDAVLRGDLGSFVWLNMGGVAVRVPVRVLFGDGVRLAVRSLDASAPPLMPGVQTVVEGAERLMPGQPLAVNTVPSNLKVPAGISVGVPAEAPAGPPASPGAEKPAADKPAKSN